MPVPLDPARDPATADAKRSTSPEVVLYWRVGCHLCEIAREDLVRLRERVPFELREVDIESDPSLHAAYLERIPVVEVEGEIVAELAVDADAVTGKLHTLSG